MSNFPKPPVPYIFDCEPMPIFPFIKSEPKGLEQKSQSHFFSHIKYEVKEEAMPFTPIKIEPEESAFIPVKIEPKVFQDERQLDNHAQENQEINFNSQQEVNYEEDHSNEDVFFLHTTFKKCKICEKTFKSDKTFIRYAKSVHQYRWLCWVCFQVLPSAKVRKIHLKQHHTRDCSCTFCSKKTFDEAGITTMRKRKNM